MPTCSVRNACYCMLTSEVFKRSLWFHEANPRSIYLASCSSGFLPICFPNRWLRVLKRFHGGWERLYTSCNSLKHLGNEAALARLQRTKRNSKRISGLKVYSRPPAVSGKPITSVTSSPGRRSCAQIPEGPYQPWQARPRAMLSI